MSGFPSNRHLAPVHSFKTQAHVHGQSHMQAAAAVRLNPSDSLSNSESSSLVGPANTLPSQPWSNPSAFGSTNTVASLSPSRNVVRQTSSANTQAGGTTSEQQPVTGSAGSGPRTRVFDPARDLNPTHSPDADSSTLSPCSSSSRSEISRNVSSQGDHSQMGQLFSSCLPGSSVPPSARPRQGPPSPELQSRFQLEVVEHPVCARASTYGDRDRRLISPPPILKLSLKDYDHNDPEDLRQLTWAYNIVHCTLWRTPHADAPSSDWVEVTEFMGRGNKPQLGLMGTLVANPFVVDAPTDDKDDAVNASPLCFYVFSDLSCRMTGLYRLRFALTKIGDDFYRQVGARSPTITYTWTNPFEVFSAKDFPGMRPSSQLLRYLKLKGAYVTIKKESQSNVAAKKRTRTGSSQNSGGSMTVDADTKRSKQLADSQYDSEERTPMSTDFPDRFGPDD